VPIPGTKKLESLEETLGEANICLSVGEVDRLSKAAARLKTCVSISNGVSGGNLLLQPPARLIAEQIS
jgi:hypothetical protein